MMSVKSILLALVAMLFFCSLAAQDYPVKLQLKEGCNYTSGVNVMSELYGYAPSEQAKAIIDEILNLYGIKNSPYRVMAGNVSNAMATWEDGVGYIIYNENFISRFSQNEEGKYAVYSILVHELGHLMLGHELGEKDPDKRPQLELLADQFSGTALRNLCATQDQALIAIRSLPKSFQNPLYPPFSAREQMIATSWSQRDEEIRDKKVVDPCGVTIPLNFGGVFKKSNLIQKAEGRIMGDQMIITYTMKNLAGENEYRPMLITDPELNVSPVSIEWISDPTQPGKNRTAIWNFKKDGYSQDQVKERERIGLAAFKKGNIPKSRRALEYTPSAALVALGGYFFSRRGILKDESAELYDNTYAQFRNENDARYLGDNPSRDEVYTMANSKHRKAQSANVFGYAFTTMGIAYLVDRFIKDKRGRRANFHYGENGIGLQLPIGN